MPSKEDNIPESDSKAPTSDDLSTSNGGDRLDTKNVSDRVIWPGNIPLSIPEKEVDEPIYPSRWPGGNRINTKPPKKNLDIIRSKLRKFYLRKSIKDIKNKYRSNRYI